MDDCLFCNIEKSRLVMEEENFYIIRDAFPETDLHTLIISKRHIQSFFELTDSEISSYTKILNKCRIDLLDQDSSILGFNVGFNDGVDAGQTIMHCHVHIIPRRSGDVINPRGGIRGVIPGKQNY
mgnify:FL=1